jgi:hypothetical protein
LFGASAAANGARRGREALEALKDSIRRAADERAGRARETLQSFHFDVTTFTLTDVAREPAVSFFVPGNDADGSAIALSLAAIEMPEQPWWTEVKQTLPEWAADSSSLHWRRPGYRVRATPVGDGSSLSLVMEREPADTGKFAKHAWEVATVVSPAYQLIALDEHPLSKETRAALSRAFDAAASVDGIGQRVSLQRAKPAIERRQFRRVRMNSLQRKRSVGTG